MLSREDPLLKGFMMITQKKPLWVSGRLVGDDGRARLHS
jgi:hypothetical protein